MKKINKIIVNDKINEVDQLLITKLMINILIKINIGGFHAEARKNVNTE